MIYSSIPILKKISDTSNNLSLYDLFHNSLKCNFCPLSTSLNLSERIAYVLQTSGTTGFPKLIRVPHSCLIPNIIDLSRIFSLSSSDVCVLSAPPTFDPSLVQIFTSLCRGCTLLIAPCSPSVITHHNTTVLQSTPSLFRTYSLDSCRSLLGESSCIRVLAFGGEICPPLSLLRHWRHPNNQTELYNVYGITEVSCWSTCHKLQLDNTPVDSNVDDVPIGQALSNTRVELRMREGVNEIWVGGSNRRCEIEGEQSEDMRNTGDIGMTSDNGDVLCVGRRDQLIKRLGCRVSLLSVERELRKIGEINNCIVMRDSDVIVAYIEISASSELMDVRRKIQTNIISKFRPDVIRNLSHIPLTTHGKLDISSLTSLSFDRLYTDLSTGVSKFLETELSLLSITPCPTPLSELGVDSFELVGIINRLQDLLTQDYSININDVFDSFYDFLSSHPSEDLTTTIIQTIEEYTTCVPSSKRIRIDSTNNPTFIETQSSPFIYIRRGTVSCSLDTLPPPLLSPPTPVSIILGWNYVTGRCVDCSPLLCYHTVSLELTVFTGSHSALFSAVRVSDGLCLWTRQLDDRIESSAVLSQCGCYLIVGTYSGKVWVLEREGGKIHWFFSTGPEPVKSSPCVDISTGLVWIGTHNHTLVALSVTQKRCVFSINTDSGSCYSSSLSDPSMRAVYVGTHGGDLLCVSGITGCVEWRRSLKSAIFSSPCLLPDHSIVVGTVDNNVYCVSRDNAVMWIYDTNSPVFSSPCILYYSQGTNILIGTYDKRIVCLNTSGNVEWETSVESEMFSIPFVLPSNHSKKIGLIAAALNNGTILLLDFTGLQLCSYKLPAEVYSSPVLVGDQLFVGCRDNNLYCLKILV
ncbi:Acyl-CoA synthetase family member 4 [Oopsacas minuta]|uniref:Acyl-CoA synthetase family member 4 n=1 Tax=Oopsacas minuta TaxID=111878 RepID=A0AAV7K899_9METZ|nr:Acyl-CoA synthetase family member 4 [Oopsacas minuta]